MKTLRLKSIIASLIVIVVSCNEPETIVTNIVYPDGSVLRKIEMRNSQNLFEESGLQVPFDSSWTIRDSIELDDKADTIWVKRAEKLFQNVEEINAAYLEDSGANRKILRGAQFTKRFRWFNSEYRFAENIERILPFGYPVNRFLNEDELQYFYYPDKVQKMKKNGPDSLMMRALADSVEYKTEIWTVSNILSGWIIEFSDMAGEDIELSRALDSLKLNESEIVNFLNNNEDDLDSLWSDGSILKMFIGEKLYKNYLAEADTALEYVIEKYWIDFKDYSVSTVMPGIVTGTNGFIDSSGVILWPVVSDYFLTDQYSMWAESKIPNRWAWIVSSIFLLFVLSGIAFRIKRRG